MVMSAKDGCLVAKGCMECAVCNHTEGLSGVRHQAAGRVGLFVGIPNSTHVPQVVHNRMEERERL